MNKKIYKKIISIWMILIFLNGICSYSSINIYAASKKLPKFIILTKYSKTMDIGDEFYIGAVASNGKTVKWKSSNSKIASVNTYGLVIAKKNGKAKITAKISGAQASCTVTVNKTKIDIAPRSVSIERGESRQIRVRTSNGSEVRFQSKKPSVASVSDTGNIYGEKPGGTYITVYADNSRETCRITVKKPVISLSHDHITLTAGSDFLLKSRTSSGFIPGWKSNRTSIANVDDDGRVYAIRAGTAQICASLDGVKKYCKVKVTK